jgi:hypothetical protein
MLSPYLLDLLRAWWKAARPRGWLFPGRDPVQPLTTRQLNRACHAAAMMAEIDKPVSLHTRRHSFATHLLEQKTDIRVHPSAARAQEARYHRALHPCRPQGARRDHQPPRATRHADEAARVNRGALVPSRAGGRGHLARSRTGVAHRQRRAGKPRAAEGYVSYRELPHGGSRRTCRALRGVCVHAHCLQLLPQSTLSEVPGRGSQRMVGRSPGRALGGALLPTSCCSEQDAVDRGLVVVGNIGLISAGNVALAALSTPVPGKARRRSRYRLPAVLRRSHPSCRAPCLHCLSEAIASNRMGRLQQAPVRRTRSGAGLSVALHAPRPRSATAV